MTIQTFTLQPFASHHPHPPITLTGTLDRKGDELAISYTLIGHLEHLTLPPLSSHPTRKHQLWETTCFEFFLGVVAKEPYWEFNLSPTGDWNVYHLNAYRQNLQEETAIFNLPFQITHHQHTSPSLTLTLNLDLSSIISPAQPLDIGIAAVIQSPTYPLTFWALTHCGSQADFHRRDSFILIG
jgi:hypothetical protein